MPPCTALFPPTWDRVKCPSIADAVGPGVGDGPRRQQRMAQPGQIEDAAGRRPRSPEPGGRPAARRRFRRARPRWSTARSSGLVETVRSCRRCIAATNRPSSGGASSTGLTSGNPPRVSGAVSGHCVPHSLEQIVGGGDGRQQRQRVGDDRGAVLGGYAGHGVAGHDDAIGGVDRVHDDVGDRDVQRNADHDDGGHPEVAQHRVEVGAAHRSDAVPPAQHQIGWLGPEFGQQRPLRACRE